MVPWAGACVVPSHIRQLLPGYFFTAENGTALSTEVMSISHDTNHWSRKYRFGFFVSKGLYATYTCATTENRFPCCFRLKEHFE